MRDEYDFTNAKRAPYAQMLKKQITINVSEEVIVYFKNLSKEVGIPYQILINYYLLDCVRNNKKLSLSWSVNNTL